MKRVLIVEDDRHQRQGLVAFLEAAGLSVVAVPGFREALDRVRRERYDLIITDLDLPGGNGMELVAAARAFRPAIQTIVVTGYGCGAVRRQASQLELLGYFEKPFDPTHLLRLIS